MTSNAVGHGSIPHWLDSCWKRGCIIVDVRPQKVHIYNSGHIATTSDVRLKMYKAWSDVWDVVDVVAAVKLYTALVSQGSTCY